MNQDIDREQERMDAEDASFRLARLSDAIAQESAARELVRSCEHQLRRAKAAHKRASEKVKELAFLEKHRRERHEGRG